MRPGIEVRELLPYDLDAFVELCITARQETSSGPQVCSPDAAVIRHQVGALTGVPGATVLIAVSEEAVVGLLLGRTVGPNLFTDQASFAVEALYVDPKHRRRGVGHALMQVAVDTAVGEGAEQVFAAPIPGARGMQRFFVRLGFTPAAAHRVTSTAALHRRLCADGGARRQGPRGLDELIARRRQARADTGQIPVAPAQEAWRGAINKHVNRAVQTRRVIESSTTIS